MNLIRSILQVIQTGDFGRSSTSYDFNVSIAANRRKDVFVTWTATDPANNVNAEVRYAARLHTDPPGVIPSPGMLLFGSATYYSVSYHQSRTTMGRLFRSQPRPGR